MRLMNVFRRQLARLASDKKGLTTVEYIIVLSLIAVVGFAIWKNFGQTVRQKVQGADGVLQGLPSSSTP